MRAAGVRRGVAVVGIGSLMAAGLLATSGAPTAALAPIARVSVSSTGAQGNGVSVGAGMSGNGRFVTFQSAATNLVTVGASAYSDVYLRDRQSATTTVVSVADDESPGNNFAFGGSPSSDGRYVVFHSRASNLVVGDTNGADDVFVRDRQAGTTERVSVGDTEAEVTGLGITEIRSCFQAPMSDDGRYVGFTTRAANMVSGDTNAVIDVFVRDRQTQTTERVSVSSAAGQGNGHSGTCALSGDGRYVAFTSSASNLVAGDTNGLEDAFVHDRQTGTTERVSLTNGGAQVTCSSFCNQTTAVGGVSDDGRIVTFTSNVPGFVPGDTDEYTNVFVRDRQAGTTTKVPGELFDYYSSTLSANGRVVAYTGVASHDAGIPSQAYAFDRTLGTLKLASANGLGQPGNDASLWEIALSADGGELAFQSRSSDLVGGDTNSGDDIFVADVRQSLPPSVMVSTPAQGGSYARNEVAPASYACTDLSGWGIASCNGTVAPGASIDTATVGTKTFTVTGTEAAGKATTKTVTYTVYDEITTDTLPPGGGTVTTDPGSIGPTAEDLIETSVTSVNAGPVSIAEGAASTATPLGFELVDVQVNITAPVASAAAPLVLVFDVDSSRVPPGETKDTLSVLRSGALLTDCPGEIQVPSGLIACVSGRADAPSGGGDIRLTVITTQASRWNVASGSPLPPAVSIASRSVVEGHSGTKTLSFPVTLSAPSALPVSVPWATTNFSAVAPGDFTAATGTLQFVPGETSKAVNVTVKGETAQESDETFRVSLSAPTNATLANTTATGTIVDDDRLTIRTSSLPAGRVGVAYSATLTGSGGVAPYKWKKVTKLPKGMKLTAKTGLISGKPKVAGTVAVTVQLSDKAKPKHTATKTFTLVVNT